MVHSRKGSECQPRSKLSNRSLSPFNPSVSYYNAIHQYKQASRKGSVCSINLEKPMSSFGGSSQGMMSLNSRAMSGLVNHTPQQKSLNNPHKDDGLPKKSKFQKKKAEPSDNKLPFGVTVKEDSSFEYSARNSNKRASRKPDQEFKLKMNDMKHGVD